MNFYQAQDEARKKTKLLVLYFALAVIGVVGALYSVFGFYMMQTTSRVYDASGRNFEDVAGEWWNADAFLSIAIGTTTVILLGNIFKSLQLSGGGAVVARDMGGRLVDHSTKDSDERRLINVVEEMAISSGLPVPQVWMMDNEPGINAFAAGTEPGNAVIGVTRGCVQNLSRSELQGVIAHEFSHILNGDMKMNMRLIGWLFGIMMISMLGKMLLYSMMFSRHRSSSRENNGGGGALAIVAAGVVMMIIGSIGVFFARLIQAAISRQREYLADASAVEFTRDPSGIAGALKKIGGLEEGASLANGKAGEASHMFFADGGIFSFGFATHPPLEVRISAIEKGWQAPEKSGEKQSTSSESNSSLDSRVSGFSTGAQAVTTQRESWNDLGNPSLNNVATGSAIISGLNPKWIDACHDVQSAKDVVYGMLLSDEKKVLDTQLSDLGSVTDVATAERSLSWSKELSSATSSSKIALLDLSIPSLRCMTSLEYERFIEITRRLIAGDGVIDVFEFMIQKVMERHLSSHFVKQSSSSVAYEKLSDITDEVNVLVSTLSGIGAKSKADLDAAYAHVTTELLPEISDRLSVLPPQECGLAQIDKAVGKISKATPMLKKQIIHACGVAVMHDGLLDDQEAEMLRAVADAVGCAIPPFVK